MSLATMEASPLAHASEAGANVNAGTNPTVDEPDATALAREVVAHICAGRLDEAEGVLAHLHECCPASRDVLAFPVMIALQRGRAHEAWQLVNGLPDEQCPDLKALCLRMLGDPLWHAYASAHVDSADPWVRKAMRQLLGHESEEPGSEANEANGANETTARDHHPV